MKWGNMRVAVPYPAQISFLSVLLDAIEKWKYVSRLIVPSREEAQNVGCFKLYNYFIDLV